MRAVVYSPWRSTERLMLAAAAEAGLDLEASPSLQAFSSALYRDPEAMGLLWSQGPTSAAMTIGKMRLGAAANRVLVLLNTTGEPGNRALARSEVLRAGADDCQYADIDRRELVARIKTMRRQASGLIADRIEFADCVYDPDAGRIVAPGGTVHLTKCEHDVFMALAGRPGTLINKDKLMDILYGGRDEPNTKIIDVFICKLRRKLASVTDGKDFIVTEWGRGWRWEEEGFRPAFSVMRKREPA